MFVLVRSGQVINTLCVERKKLDECEDREEKRTWRSFFTHITVTHLSGLLVHSRSVLTKN